MYFFGRKTKTAQAPAIQAISNDGPDILVENLYKKNIELSVKNKTLSLLSKLYEVGILTLQPNELASRIAQAVQSDLSFELVGIYLFENTSDSLAPLIIAQSEKSKKITDASSLQFDRITVAKASEHAFFKKIIIDKTENMTRDTKEVWSGLVPPDVLQDFAGKTNIKTTIVHPLMVENGILGAVMFALNRDYETLSPFEKESEKSIVNIIALTLEKAFLYQRLETANENLKELDRQKDELLGIVSHQLAAPVTAIKWYTEILLDGEVGTLTPEQHQQIQTMQTVTSGLADLVSMILDVSRIRLNRIHVEPQEMDLGGFMQELISVVEPKAKEKSIRFMKNIPDNLPVILLDKRLTRMTLENLLTNAIKYTPEHGNVEFEISIQDDWIHVRVADTGCGIPEAEHDKVFGKLYRATNVRNTIDGNGFGLYVAKGAVEAQGGTIEFQSAEGKGTTFLVALPLKK